MNPRPTLFFDTSLGTRVPLALRAEGANVLLHREFYKSNVADVVWIPQIAVLGHTIITKDKAIVDDLNERASINISSAKVFCIDDGNLPTQPLLELMRAVLPEIERITNQETGPFVYLIGSDQTLTRIM